MKQKIFFTADLHFGHEKVIKFDNRPFANLEEMQVELIKKWNNKVAKGDLVYVLGDMFWKGGKSSADIIKQLNGNIILICGNHDRFHKDGTCKKLLGGIYDYKSLTVPLQRGEKQVFLSHYYTPLYNGYLHGGIHLYGHFHNNQEHRDALVITNALRKQGYNIQAFNIGCMLWDYEPVTLEEILEKGNKI